MTPFTEPITPGDVAELIDFTVADNCETESMARMQREGVAALYNILCKGPIAYLADEVGMGKTYQALGLAALTWYHKPGARILFVSPRQNLQEKWVDDYKGFFASNYRRQQKMGDDRVTSVLFGEPVHRPVAFDNLRSWTPTIGMPEQIAAFLRHTSFMRPVFVRSGDLTGDMDQLWREWRDRFRGWTLFESRRPRGLSSDNASGELNVAFARALNAKLAAGASCGEPYFDLVVVDEAQCLRNPENQTNRVLYEALKCQVVKWLFMSATPAHGGPGDIPRIVNKYPNCGEILDGGLVSDLRELQKALGDFMVRRQRRYLAKDRATMVGKDEYRDHDRKRWAVEGADMSALSTLAMGLVQKGLVDVLASRNNRYRIGFLSSFESLQSSVRPVERAADFEHDHTQGSLPHAADGSLERDAPDAGFIDELTVDFQKRFDMPLPHAKVDSVVDRIAPLAFGSDDEVGGRKFLIFARRVSTVHALRDRLVRRHRLAVEGRMRRCWNAQELDWAGDNVGHEDAVAGDDSADSESHEDDAGDDPLRRATASVTITSASSPAVSSRCSTPMDRAPSNAPSPPRSNPTPRTSEACVTSSTSTARNPTSPRRSPSTCPTTRGYAHSPCVPMTSPTTTACTTNPTPATRTHIAMTTMNKTPTNDSDSIRQRLRAVGLYGLAVQDAAVLSEPWVERVIDIEDRERKRRSLERRLANARIGPFKPVADFDWAWPKRIDRPLIEELFSLAFVDDATNVVFVGPNGVGKTMFVKNLLHHGVLNGLTARFTTASDMLHELAAQDSDASLARRLRRFTGPQLLAIDEVGYLTYDNRYADLLFEVVTRRYLSVPVLITTNKPFSEWADVFSSAACVVTLVDRLIHRSEIVHLDGESYRLREAKEQAAKRSKDRSRRSAKSRASRGASS